MLIPRPETRDRNNYSHYLNLSPLKFLAARLDRRRYLGLVNVLGILEECIGVCRSVVHQTQNTNFRLDSRGILQFLERSKYQTFNCYYGYCMYVYIHTWYMATYESLHPALLYLAAFRVCSYLFSMNVHNNFASNIERKISFERNTLPVK